MIHKITSQDQWFLKMRRRDPLQGREFELGDKVVVCSKCRCVQTYDSWEFNENKCVQCGHNYSTGGFSREYIDLSYHRENKEIKNIHGFKVVESDIKYQTDKIRKWFSRQRIARTYKERLWFHIILLILVVGSICYWGHDSMEYCVSTNILPLLSHSVEKLSDIIDGSRFNMSAKIDSLDWNMDKLLYKITFIHGKFIMLGTSLLYIGKKIIYSFTQPDLESKGSTIITNIREIIDYISQFIKR